MVVKARCAEAVSEGDVTAVPVATAAIYSISSKSTLSVGLRPIAEMAALTANRRAAA